jgi:hypothetical protein
VHNGGAEFLQSLVQKFLFFHVTPGKEAEKSLKRYAMQNISAAN